MQENQTNTQQENIPSLLRLLEDASDTHRLISKTYAAAMALYESFDADRDFSARVGDKVLSFAAEVICDYSREADDAMSKLYKNLDKLFDYYHEEK